MTNVSIIGSSRIVEEHIRACIQQNINIIGIFSFKKKSNSCMKLSKKYKIQMFNDFKKFLIFSKNNKSNFIIAPRIIDNEQSLKSCLKYGKKIFIEKPVFENYRKFEKYEKYQNRIFIGFNRIYYKNVQILRSKLRNTKNEILVVCPEKNLRSVNTNSCHIISILVYIFGNLNLIYKQKEKNKIFCIFKAKKSYITIIFKFKSKDLFRIENFSSNEKIILSPIEILKTYNSLVIRKYKNNNIYSLKKLKETNEYDLTNIKPGFLEQMKQFKLFIKSNKKIINNIIFAKEVIKICNKITL